MFRQIALASALALVTATQAPAHSEGHGSIDPTQVLAAAVNATDYLTRETIDRDWSPLPASWAELPTSSARILAIVDGDYVVAITNPEDGQIFYILFSNSGSIIEANFTGTFPYVYDAQDPSTWTTD
jgi:hypothetical protein